MFEVALDLWEIRDLKHRRCLRCKSVDAAHVPGCPEYIKISSLSFGLFYDSLLIDTDNKELSSQLHAGSLVPPPTTFSTVKHQTQYYRWSELSFALTEQWQLDETHWTQAQSPATWQMKHIAAASRGTGQENCTDLVRSCRAVETRRLFSFLQSSLSRLLLSSSLLSLCAYVRVYVCEWVCVR